MEQKMVWKRLCFGESEETAKNTLEWARREGSAAKITKGKTGYSVMAREAEQGIKQAKPILVCNHCFMTALKRKYGQVDGKRIWWLECPSCGKRH